MERGFFFMGRKQKYSKEIKAIGLDNKNDF
jgi:hypothetical protein